MTLLQRPVATQVVTTYPTTEYGAAQPRLRLDGSSAYAFIQFGLPTDLRKGAVVASATLRVTQATTWTSASRTMTARRAGGAWKVSTINWANMPGSASPDHTKVLTSGAAGTVWDIDVTSDVQSWADGTTLNRGWRLAISTAGLFPIHGPAAASGAPTLDVVYYYAPGAPTSLEPSGGSVSVAKPVLRWNSVTPATVRVMVDPAANGTTPGFDSGTVAQSAEQLDLSTTAYAGLSAAASTQWRVQVTSLIGSQLSPWSQWATFTRTAKPTLTITTPTTTVSDTTPPIAWTSSGQRAFQVFIAKSTAPQTILYDSGPVTSTTLGHTPTKAVITDTTASYIITVRTWDTVVRDATAGDPTYSVASVTVTLSYSGAVTAVTSLTATQASKAPWVDLSFARATTPDGWRIIRDGLPVYATDTGADLFVSGTTYAWRDYTADPNKSHVYRAAPRVGGLTASGGPTATITPTIAGVWLGDPTGARDVLILGREEVSATYGEESNVLLPIGATSTVSVVTALRGLEGTVSGLVTDAFGRLGATEVATLLALKATPAATYRLAWGDLNIPVVLRKINPTPRRVGTSPGVVARVVDFEFLQIGELPFTADL